MYIEKNDILINKNLYKLYNGSIFFDLLISYTNRSLRQLHKILMLPLEQKIYFDFMNEGDQGYFNFVNRSIYVDPRQIGLYELLRAISHEAIHAEQYFLGMWRHEIKNNKYFIICDGIEYELQSNDFIRYNVPWEKDAYHREQEVTIKLLALLEEEEKMDEKIQTSSISLDKPKKKKRFFFT